jgi:hypothetical protein
MILEVARSLTEWFNDPLHGIAACLAIVPREPGDALPVIGTIAEQTADNAVAQLRFPSIPGIAVNVRQIAPLDGANNTVTGDGTADILVRIARSDQDTAVAAAETSYILRAVLMSWRRFNLNPPTRNNLQIYHCDQLLAAPDFTPIEGAIVTGAITGMLEFRDLLS